MPQFLDLSLIDDPDRPGHFLDPSDAEPVVLVHESELDFMLYVRQLVPEISGVRMKVAPGTSKLAVANLLESIADAVRAAA